VATTRILYSQAGQTGKMLAQAVHKVVDGIADFERVKLLLDKAQTGGDWAAVAAELGGGINSTQAQAAWTIVANALAQLQHAAVGELANLDQG
jgi:hypothetical protein